MFTRLSTAKHHLLLDDEFTLDDSYIISLIETAENAVSKALNKPLCACVTQEGLLPPTIQHSILLLVGSLYSQRESVAPVQLHKTPHSLDWLLGLDRHYNIPK